MHRKSALGIVVDKRLGGLMHTFRAVAVESAAIGRKN
jgi:hypothetical protein